MYSNYFCELYHSVIASFRLHSALDDTALNSAHTPKLSVQTYLKWVVGPDSVRIPSYNTVSTALFLILAIEVF